MSRQDCLKSMLLLHFIVHMWVQFSCSGKSLQIKDKFLSLSLSLTHILQILYLPHWQVTQVLIWNGPLFLIFIVSDLLVFAVLIGCDWSLLLIQTHLPLSVSQ